MAINGNNKAIYLQIADRLCNEIMKRWRKPDERIPSVREYAIAMQVNPNTAMHSYEWLEREGIIYNKRGIGYFVAPDAVEKIGKLKLYAFLNFEADYFFNLLKTIGMTPEEIAKLYEEYLNSGK